MSFRYPTLNDGSFLPFILANKNGFHKEETNFNEVKDDVKTTEETSFKEV